MEWRKYKMDEWLKDGDYSNDIFHLSSGRKSKERCLSGSMVTFSLAITSTREEKPQWCVTDLKTLFSEAKISLQCNVY